MDPQDTLEIVFFSRAAFEHEYTTNIANGGIFVATEQHLEVRQKVSVRVKLAYARKGTTLRGEVVHVVGPELAESGATPGVAVQLEAAPNEIRRLFAPLFESGFESGPVPAPESGAAEPGRTTGRPAAAAPKDRRGAPRSRARVRARVHCPGCDMIEGRTRDLSISGVLVSIGNGPVIDVGEPVKVWITNPQTGVEREILGKVARHVKGEGGVVRAIGVQFFIHDCDKQAVESFLRDLRSAEHSRHLGGIQGSISELGLGNLAQTFGLAAREGTLDVISGAEEGYLAFESGQLIAANVGGTTGVKALARMLTWTRGRFEFHARIDPALPKSETIALDAALLEAMRLLDEGARPDRDRLAPETRLGVVSEVRVAALDLTKLDEAVLDLAASGMNVQRILDVVPEPDTEIHLALWTLVERGLLRVEPS
jgi:Tfp pilus assembly protein PilZ